MAGMGQSHPPQLVPAESAPSHRGSVPFPKRHGLGAGGTSQLDPDAHQKNTREQRFALCSGLGFTSAYTGSIIRPGRRGPGRREPSRAAPAAVQFPLLLEALAGMLDLWPPRRSAWLEPKNHPLPGAELRRPALSAPSASRAALPRGRLLRAAAASSAAVAA